MKRMLPASLIAAAVLSAAAACSSSGTGTNQAVGGSGGQTISVLALQALSGPLAPSGQADTVALKAAVAVVNASGGVNGRKLKLTIEDDQGKGSQALALLQAQLGSGGKPDVLIDGSTSPEAIALQPLVTRNNILAISDASGYLTVDPSVSANRTKFSTASDVGALAQEMAAHLKAKGYRKVALLASSDAYGKLWATGNATALKSAGLELTGTASFDDSTLDVTPQLQALQATKPDVLIGEAYGSPAGYLLTDRAKLGWTGTPFVGAITFSTIDLTKLADKSAFKNVTVQAAAIEKYVQKSQMSPGARAFFSAIQEQGPIAQPLSQYGYQYDPVMLAAAAISKAGSTDPLKVSHALENLGPVSGTVMQQVYYTPQTHFPTADPAAFTFLAPGPLVDGMIKSET